MPQGWSSELLVNLVTSQKGKKPDQLKSSMADGFLPYLDILAIEKQVIRQFADITSSRICNEDDVLVVWDGARSGWVGMAKAGAIGSTIMALSPQLIESKYLLYFLNSQFKSINTNTRGTGIPHVDPELFWNIAVPIPPLNEQRRIVAKLEALLSKVDACQQRLARIPVILKRFRQAMLAAACSGRLTADWREKQGIGEGDDLPEGWSWTSIGKYCTESFYGPRFGKDEYTDNGIPTIRTTDFTENGSILLKNPPKIRIDEKKKEKFLLKQNDLLVTRTGSIGKMAIFRESFEALPSAYLIRFRFSDEILVDYIFQALMSPLGQEKLGLGATAVTQPNINAETIKELVFPLPPLPEQQEIVRRVETLFKLADQLEARYTAAQAQVDKLTQSILTKAFRGELVPQDPNDEPAEKLLERIREQRESATTQPRNKKASPSQVVQHTPVAEPPAAALSDLSKTARKILRHMKKGHTYAKHELTTAAMLSTSEWNSVIRELKEAGLVLQTGDKRGASYSRP